MYYIYKYCFDANSSFVDNNKLQHKSYGSCGGGEWGREKGKVQLCKNAIALTVIEKNVQ